MTPTSTFGVNTMLSSKHFFLLPALLTLVAIILFPLLFTIRVSFSSWDVFQSGLDYIGGKNYGRVLADERFWQSLGRLSLLSLISVSLQYTLGFALALAVWKQVRGGRFLRVLFLIPMMTTPVVMSVIWRTVFHESLGPANDILGMFVEVWQWTPFMFLLLLAGLVSLPREPYLAAAIDGAGTWRTFWQVTFPLMAPITIGALIIRLIEASKIMDTVYVLTSGGPGTATETSSYYIYIRGLRDFQIGYSAALSLVYLVIMIVSLTVIAKLLLRLLVGKVG
jgi:multiple sugar transport system permease protein